MMEAIIDPGAGVGDIQHIKQGGLFNLFVCIEVCFKTRENFFPHGGQKLGVIASGVEDDVGFSDEFPFFGCVVREIGFDAQGPYFRDSQKPTADGRVDVFFMSQWFDTHFLTSVALSMARAMTSSRSRVSNRRFSMTSRPLMMVWLTSCPLAA